MPMPRTTTGRVILGAALLAACTPVFLFLIWEVVPAYKFTVYAPGYTEAKFNTLTPGMSPDAVEAVMGKPLERVPWATSIPGRDDEMWFYTDNRVATANFWRRWVLFEHGKSTTIFKDLWLD